MLRTLRYAVRKVFGTMPKLLPVGSKAPPFSVQDHEGHTVTSESLAGQRFVLWFFPKADTPGCTRQGCGFRDQSPGYQQRGVKVLGVSFDTMPDNRLFVKKFSFPFPLLCDTKREMGLAYKACDSAVDPYPNRITYVIGPDGTIEQALETKDPGGQAAALLESLPKK
jgi:peroxiredoxin Q/BCP